MITPLIHVIWSYVFQIAQPAEGGGRALTYSMYPLTVPELGEDFNLNHSLRYGLLPSVFTEEDPKRYLESYVKTYLEEEVRQEGLTRNLGAFTRFLLRDYPMAKAYFIYGGERRMHDGDIEIVPISDALKKVEVILSSQKL